MTEHGFSIRIRRPMFSYGRRDERDAKIPRQQTADQIVDVTFQASEAMKWIDRPRENGYAQRLSFTRSHAASVER